MKFSYHTNNATFQTTSHNRTLRDQCGSAAVSQWSSRVRYAYQAQLRQCNPEYGVHAGVSQLMRFFAFRFGLAKYGRSAVLPR